MRTIIQEPGDENTCYVDGVRHQAIEAAECIGCVADIIDRLFCTELPPCAADYRQDSRNIIWVAASPN